MPNERDIALRALRAAGHTQAADLVEAILPDASAGPAGVSDVVVAAPVVAVAPEIGHAPPAGAPVAPIGPQPPADRAPLRTMEDLDALSQAEMVARMDEVDAVLAEQ